MFAAAEATGRTGELDLACLNTVMETAARLRLPGILTVNLSPRTMEMDDFSVHALVRLIVRHGLDPRQVVLELTEREAVEDLGPAAARGRGVPRRRHPARRRRRRRRATPGCGCSASSASTSSRSTCRWSRAAPSATPRSRSSGRCATWPTAGARSSSPRASRRRPSSTSSARSGSGPARATCSAGRPTGRRPSRSTSRGSAGARNGSSSGSGRCRHDRRATTPDHRVAVDASTIPARLPATSQVSLWPSYVETRLGWFGSGDRRKVAVVVTSDGRRVHVPIDPRRRRIPPRPSSLASGA